MVLFKKTKAEPSAVTAQVNRVANNACKTWGRVERNAIIFVFSVTDIYQSSPLYYSLDICFHLVRSHVSQTVISII
jgi:hypothetical protein